MSLTLHQVKLGLSVSFTAFISMPFIPSAFIDRLISMSKCIIMCAFKCLHEYEYYLGLVFVFCFI